MIDDKVLEAATDAFWSRPDLTIKACMKLALEAAEQAAWSDMGSAPKDGTQIWVKYDHEADPYFDGKKLTDYAANAEGTGFLDGVGFCVATWCDGYTDGNPMEGEPECFIPGCWFAWESIDNGPACNPTAWRTIPGGPTGGSTIQKLSLLG